MSWSTLRRRPFEDVHIADADARRAATLERRAAQARAELKAPARRVAVVTPCSAVVLAQPKAPTARPGKRTPTVAERVWMDAIVAYGCIACRMDGHPSRPAAVHHILRGGQRIGHLFTLPLCDPGHHQGGDCLGLTSRHPWKARFEVRYGNEMDLLAQLQQALKLTGVVHAGG